MPEQPKKTTCGIGVLAHVDAGKTTLSEAMLYLAGAKRTLGRVDHGDAALDTDPLERSRGITIFSKQARLSFAGRELVLLDTPGHADFAPEAERVMPVLDCAVLVVSGTDGVQAHTLTLWGLLGRYNIPVFLFVNKMDLPGSDREKLLSQLRDRLSPGCVPMDLPQAELEEAAAVCDDALLEQYLSGSPVTDGNLRELIQARKLFPVCFGSALRLSGVEALLHTLARFAPEKAWPAEFGARVYKISRDPQGNRLTWLRVTGGELRVRMPISYRNLKGETLEEKPIQLRLYSGEKFILSDTAPAGTLAAVTGLTATWAGQALGAEEAALPPVLAPVMTYRVELPKGVDPAQALPKLKLLEEEEPQLRLLWEGDRIHVQIMGRVQLEVFTSLVRDRLGMEVTLEDRRIFYKETIVSAVEGVGHFEPLRHYAEVHLLLEPLPAGSGLVFDTVCPTDVLDGSYQSLILTHLGEKIHRGVLTGAPITDMKLTLLVGKAHLKHTEGGDFRQATYRAVRQGLMQAESVLLEPWYDFSLTAPTEAIGRAITDIRAMGGEFDAPQASGDMSILKGTVPAGEVRDYADTLAAYTRGRGRLQLAFHGYAPCHNAREVIENTGYDPEADTDNTPDSVFCAHGAGFNVKWDRVKDYMHLESGLKTEKPPVLLQRSRIDDRELEAIMEREFGPARRRVYTEPAQRSAKEEVPLPPPRQKWILVDGYNVIFAWEHLKKQAEVDLDAARRQLCDALASYAGFTESQVVVVFDGYRKKGNPGEKERYHNIRLVFTGEGETADRYLEELAAGIGKNDSVWVASSDSLVQLSSFRSGVLRMSARELEEEAARASREMGKFLKN